MPHSDDDFESASDGGDFEDDVEVKPKKAAKSKRKSHSSDDDFDDSPKKKAKTKKAAEPKAASAKKAKAAATPEPAAKPKAAAAKAAAPTPKAAAVPQIPGFDPSDTNPRSAILNYMTHQNRPYSYTIIQSNLHNAFGKSIIEKTLADLATEGLLTCKEYGKSKLYMATQDSKAASPEQLAELDTEIASLQAEKNKIADAVTAAKAELRGLTAEPEDDALESEIQNLTKELAAKEKKLAGFQSGQNAMPSGEVDKLNAEFNKYVTEWKKRRKGCMEFVALFGEQSGAKSWTAKKFMADRGVDTDEMVKVNIEDWLALTKGYKPPVVKPSAKPAPKGKKK